MKAAEEEVDHINGDTLDNRRENLRLVTHQQNLFNQRAQEGCSSKYRGVYKSSTTAGWTVQIKHNGRVRTIHGIE
ncbi:MAG: HNH endonuclease, partial [Bacteroidota bacterium]